VGLQRPRRGVGKRACGLIVGGCFSVAGGLGFAGAGRVGAGASTLCSGAGGVISGNLGSGAGGEAELVVGARSLISKFGRFGFMRW